MACLYLVALALGAGLFGLLLYLVLGFEGDHQMPWNGFALAGLGLTCAGYSLTQLMRPTPQQDPRESDAN